MAPGAAVSVDILLPPGTVLSSYYKYGGEPGMPADHWYEFLDDGTTGAVLGTELVTLKLVDGDRGDDDLSANGIIVDPGAPVVAVNEEVLIESATVWLGLKNSDDQGTQFDLRTEAYVNGVLIAAGETRCITGLTRNANQAKEVVVDLAAVAGSELELGDELSLRVLTRIGTNPDDTKCSGPGGSHNNAAGLRLYYGAVSRPSRLSAEVPPAALGNYYLKAGAVLDAAAPTATNAIFKDSASVKFAGGNAWKDVGAWSLVHP